MASRVTTACQRTLAHVDDLGSRGSSCAKTLGDIVEKRDFLFLNTKVISKSSGLVDFQLNGRLISLSWSSCCPLPFGELG